MQEYLVDNDEVGARIMRVCSVYIYNSFHSTCVCVCVDEGFNVLTDRDI
jgi:hypothetical protein